LAYRDLLLEFDAIVEKAQRSSMSLPFQAICIGGGAGSEVIGLASLGIEGDDRIPMHITTVDSGDWNSIIDDMRDLVYERWNGTAGQLDITALHQDVLDTYTDIDFEHADLVTLLFTTNELFAASKPKTLALLAHLSSSCRPGTLLLVAESVGTYSEMTVGGKTYPLTLIMDQTLAGRDSQWKIVEKDDGRWYRVPEETKARYKLQLENTHMMVRLYEKL
jgi:25S rRNA (uracil2843-N3)-methyltransferase